MGGGLSAGQARAINGNNVNATVTATGSTQGGAQVLNADGNIITTATSLQGVILYAGVPGDTQWVYNGVAGVPITVYPPTGAKINQLAANAGMVLAPYTGVVARCLSATQWLANLSA